jgi:ADP-ribose pyrophosphatase
VSRRAVHRHGHLTLWEKVLEAPTGPTTYCVLEVGRTVAIVPLLEADRVVLVRQYRHVAGRDSWEVPAGGVGPDEDLLAAAQRELREEAGYRAARFEPLAAFQPSNAYVDETAYLYLAIGLVPDPLPADPDEAFVVCPHPLEQAVRLALAGEIFDGLTVAGLLAADRLRRAGRLPLT